MSQATQYKCNHCGHIEIKTITNLPKDWHAISYNHRGYSTYNSNDTVYLHFCPACSIRLKLPAFAEATGQTLADRLYAILADMARDVRDEGI